MSLTKHAADNRRKALVDAFTKFHDFPGPVHLDQLLRAMLTQISDLNLNLSTINAKLDALHRSRQTTLKEGEKHD